MDQEQRNALLDILIDKVSPSELKYFVFVLEPVDFDRLSGNTHDEKCISFMKELYRKGKEDRLLEEIIDRRPDIDFSPFDIVLDSPSEIKEPQPTEFLPFANREKEWEKVVLYPEKPYHLFDAPAGYGKTALLKKIQEEFVDRGWFCAYVASKEEETGDPLTLPSIFERLAQELEIQPNIYLENPRRTSLEIGKAIIEKHKDQPGIALLFDVDRAPRDDFIPVLKTVVETVIPSIWETLKRKSDFFGLTPKNYRVAVAGRYLATKIREFEFTYKFDVTRLEPFEYQVAQDICTPYVGNRLLDQAERDDFAAHLLFHSGGHPRCMARILQEFERRDDLPNEFFDYCQERIEEIASEEIGWVRRSIASNLRQDFESLCVYRRFDYTLLRKLLEVPHLIWPGLAEDEYDLAMKLKQSYLVDWTGENYQHLSDDITRRLLVLRRIDDGPVKFREDCEKAKEFYTERLRNSSECRPFWALEMLAEYLQAHVVEVGDLKRRQALRQEFVEKELPEVLRLLIKDQDPRVQYEPLKLILAQDWELQFMVNYYLRGDIYSPELYKEVLLQRIDQFFAQAIGL